MEKVHIHFHLKCKKIIKNKKKNGCNELHPFQFPRSASCPKTGNCILENQESYGFVFRQCETENFFDFNKGFIYRILKMVNDLYLIQRWQQKEQ